VLGGAELPQRLELQTVKPAGRSACLYMKWEFNNVSSNKAVWKQQHILRQLCST
jgi:hypothetical protein